MLLKYLLLPPGVFIFGLFASLAAMRAAPRAGRIATWAFAGALYVFSTPAFVGALFAPLEHTEILSPAELSADLQSADAIVILSGDKTRADGEFGDEEFDAGSLTLPRLRYGAFLHGVTGAPILVTGGGRDGEPTVAEVMAGVLARDYRVSAKWLEMAATNTYENAKFSRELLAPEGIDRIYLVTHAWHMPRAEYIFKRQGFEVVPAPTAFATSPNSNTNHLLNELLPSPRALAASYYVMHEYIGGLWYRLRY